MKLKYNARGITLIALVVTIVVLIILAVISINSVFGEDGLIASAERGSIEHTHATVWEAMEMEYSNYWIDKVMVGGDLITYLQNNEKIAKEKSGKGYVINTENLLGARVSLGNGTDGENDVYKLEEVTLGVKYEVKYYGPSGERLLGILGDNISNLIESDDPNFEIEKREISEPKNGEYYEVGDQIKYEITAKNIGEVVINDIHVIDVLMSKSGSYQPGSGKLELVEGENSEKISVGEGYWIISSLEPDETETITYTYTVQETDITEKSTIVNTITELTGVPQPTVPRGHKIPQVEIGGKVGIDVVKEVLSKPREGIQTGYSSEGYIPEDEIQYQITVTNTGTVTLVNIQITDILVNNYEDEIERKNYTIDRLTPGESKVITYTHIVTGDDESRDLYGYPLKDTPILKNTVHVIGTPEEPGYESPEDSDMQTVPIAKLGVILPQTGSEEGMNNWYVIDNNSNDLKIRLYGKRTNLRYNQNNLVEIYKVAEVDSETEVWHFKDEYIQLINELLKKYHETEIVSSRQSSSSKNIVDTCLAAIRQNNITPDVTLNIGEVKPTPFSDSNINDIYLVVANESWCDEGYDQGGADLFSMSRGYDIKWKSKSSAIEFKDEKGNSISGVEWVLCNKDKNIICKEDGTYQYHYTSTENPITLELLESTYYIKVLKVPNGYKIPEDTILNSRYDNKLIVRLFETTYNIKVNCVDETGKEIKEAVCVIRDETGNIIKNDDGTPKYSFTSNGEVVEIEDIPKGNYFISIVATPEGYETPADVPFIMPDYNNQTINVVFKSEDSEI